MVSAAPAQANPVRFELLDVCRFVAAFAVVIFHWLYKGIELDEMNTVTYSPFAGIAAYGYLGVYFFFMISGFVIAASSQGRTASEFAVRRLIRLYPAFWVAVTITTITILLIGGTVFTVTIPQYLANLTMMPGILHQPLIDNSYWTLFCELLFYGMIFLFLLVGLGKRLEVFYPGWAIMMLALTLVTPNIASMPLLGTFYAYFAAGAIVSTIQRNGWSWWQAVGLAASAYVSVSYTVAEAGRINDASTGLHLLSLPLVGALAVAFFGIMLVQIIPSVAAWKIPKSRILGALTYPLYLLHAHIGYMLFNRFANDENKWVAYIVVFAIILGGAYLLYAFVELRPKRMWSAAFDGTVGRALRWVERIVARALPKRRVSARREWWEAQQRQSANPPV
ncbi:acyltransferase [Microbacterium sp. LWH11-1.2]|uniref:acyltransferase family protein n=1 Tax=Microbacterium sp. LWH11-1.2 TaxID=3135258 RepID=UPI0031394CE3